MKRTLNGITAFLFGILITPIATIIISIETLFYKNEKIDL